MSFRKRKLLGNYESRLNSKINEVPDQFNDYMKGINTRFCEICELYLKGLSMDDIKYLEPEDLINLVPESQYKHKLLMTIMVRRYIYREDDDVENSKCCNDKNNDKVMYGCKKCGHSCPVENCDHKCEK